MQKAAKYLRLLSSRPSLVQWHVQEAVPLQSRTFHASARQAVVKPFILADIGEGIKEVQIIQWFVQPGARVEQFDKICEVQSDKASVDISSRFDGVIKKLHYEADAMAQVGKPLCDIDIQGDIALADEKLLTPAADEPGEPSDIRQTQAAGTPKESENNGPPSEQTASQNSRPNGSRKSASLATPAVRGLLKELRLDIGDIEGTGRDGRVLKEDVQKFVASRNHKLVSTSQQPLAVRSPIDHGQQRETTVSLTPIQSSMFKAMTQSLTIPHFLYADEVNLSEISALRKNLNNRPGSPRKLSLLPFIMKAVSMALSDFPTLNARVDVPEDGSPPKLTMREKHNIGVAMDTPQGLLVPNIKNVAALSVYEIAEQLAYIQERAKVSKLVKADLSGGTITVSNIGSIGGTYATPLLVKGEVAILATGKTRDVPAFNEDGDIIRKTLGNFSWCADHRVVDGATMARMGERVRQLLEEPGVMLAGLR